MRSLAQGGGGGLEIDAAAVKAAVDKKESISGVAKEPITVTVNGKSVKLQGEIEIVNGEIKSGEQVTTQEGTNANNAVDVKPKPTGVDIASAASVDRPARGDKDKPAKMKEATEVKEDGQRLEAKTAKYLQYGELEGDNIIGFQSEGDGRITVLQADRITLPDGILTKIQSFSGHEIKFHIGSAQDVLIGCIAMRQVRDSDFTINEKNIVIEPAKGVEFDIADCGFSQNHFKAYSENSKITISKSQRANYKITEGELTCNSRESSEILQTNETSQVQYGSTCFSCLSLSKDSIYWYNADDMMQDFAMNVPKEGDTFKLCLRKQPLDHFSSYDGLVDFIDKKITLAKKIKYLRYPFKDDRLASVIMENVLENKENATILLSLDDDLIFIDEIEIALDSSNNPIQTITPLKTITNPNNFIELREKQIQNETHRLLKINYRLDADQLQQERIYAYTTSYFEPKIKIWNGTLAQQSSGNVITALEPENIKIEEILA